MVDRRTSAPRFRALLALLAMLAACASARPPAPAPAAPTASPAAKEAGAKAPGRAAAVRGDGDTAAGGDAAIARGLDLAQPVPTKAEGPAADPPPQDTTTAWRVPVGRSPVRGKDTALVTLIMFGDFECKYCRKAHATVMELEKLYGDRLRLVFKHQPLPFHERAEPAAELALEARAQKGDAAFWKAFDLLYDPGSRLEADDLGAHAAALGLDVSRTKKAIAAHRHAAEIEADQDLADDLDASATPTFFMNGRRLRGAQPLASFRRIVDDEIARATALVAAGTPATKVYDALQKDARPGNPPERIVVPPPTAAQPAKGAPLGAKVTVQVFADIQCRFCKKVQPELDRLIAAYPGKVRLVWRHLPISSIHAGAHLAAEAAMEAFRQKGDAAFWSFVERLREDQSDDGLSRATIESKAKAAGLDVKRLSAALDAGTHRATIAADIELAERLRVTGTPAFAVNDYFVGGARALRVYKRLVDKALGPYEPIAPGSLHGQVPAGGLDAKTAPAADVKLGAKHLLVVYAGSRRATAGISRSRDEARARALLALDRAKRGVPFEQVVAEFSDEPGAADRGGDLGTFPKSAMVAEFVDALVQVRVGELSGVVETPFGFHIILRTR